MPRPLMHALPVIIAVCALLAVWAVRNLGASEPPTLPKAARDLPAGKPGELRTVVVAGGCFWCEEAVFEQLKGVTTVVAGYAGGTAATATYEQYEESNHAEAVKITYDASIISFGDLLRVLFAAGEPTFKDGQKPDYGHQYRMAVFYQNDEEKQVAEAYISQLTAAKVYAEPIQATVEAMPEGFFSAEGYHQHFVSKNPDHPYVCTWSLRKIARIRAAFPDQVKTAELAPPNK